MKGMAIISDNDYGKSGGANAEVMGGCETRVEAFWMCSIRIPRDYGQMHWIYILCIHALQCSLWSENCSTACKLSYNSERSD